MPLHILKYPLPRLFCSRAEPRASTLAVLAASLAVACGESQQVAVQSSAAAIYARTDTNATTIWAPRAEAQVRFGEGAAISGVYALDSWTSASIDITTAATKAVHELRHEATGGASYDFANVGLSASYRYSTENDYWSHGGVASLRIDMAQKNTILALAAFGSSDTVGREGRPDFRRPQNSLGGRLSLLQVLGRIAVGQLSYELTRIGGYQASPYRFVAIGGQGTCAGTAQFCLPERHPDERVRHAIGGEERTALGKYVSIGLRYRFYYDDWKVMSHTIQPDLSFAIGDHGSLALTHRFYTQRSAYFYLPRYIGGPGELRYVSRDRKLSTLYDNQVGLTYEQGFVIGAHARNLLLMGLRASLTRIVYQDFVGLRRVDVLEATLSLGTSLR